MAECKTCIHDGVCHLQEMSTGLELEEYIKEFGCEDFKNKADVVEVKWIPVAERLPKGRRKYLCICVFGESKMQFYDVLTFHPEQDAENGYVTGPHFSNEGMNDMRVTHWMQLPKPPCTPKERGGEKWK